MLGNKWKKWLQICKPKDSQPKNNVFVEVLVLNVMVRRRLTRKDLLHISIGSLLLLVTAFILTYGVILHQVDRKIHLAHTKQQDTDKSLVDTESRHTKRVKFKFKPKVNSNAAGIGASPKRITIWRPSDFLGKPSDMPRCVTNSKFLVVITSAPTHSDRRSAIRKTWCNPYASEHSQDSWQCVFLIGSVDSEIVSRKVKKEMSVYHDILLGSYIDSYRNLTYKVFNAFSWSKSFCPIDFVLKTDDDCFVNTKLLYQFLTTYNDKTSDLYAGNIFMEDSNRPVIRNEMNKWHVDEDAYSGESYPAYASGTGYILSQDVISRVVDESEYHKPIPIEDAYTGIVVNSLGIVPVQSARFMTFSSGLTLCNYLYLFVSHNVNADKQFEMHNNMMMAHSKCHNDEKVTSWF